MKKSIFLLIAVIAAACGSSEQPKDKTFQLNGVGLGGYDPVAYFEQGEAALGNEIETSSFDGITYHFSSTKNKALFDQNPQQYIPAYGGWCAYAIAEKSAKMQPDPTMFKVQDGRLLLFYDDWMTSITGSLKSKWNEDSVSYLNLADQNWVNVAASSE